MMSFIPVFPLQLIVFPGEKVNLHIFEPRYKQLISECIAENKRFGMPVFLDNHLTEFGTTIEILELVKTYEDGKMDIKCEGKSVFRIVEYLKEVPDKLYDGSIVNYIENVDDGLASLRVKIFNLYNKLFEEMDLEKLSNIDEFSFSSFDLAHHVGFNISEELEVLKVANEKVRQKMLLDQLRKILPIVVETKRLKKRVSLNGHFKNLKSPL